MLLHQLWVPPAGPFYCYLKCLGKSGSMQDGSHVEVGCTAVGRQMCNMIFEGMNVHFRSAQLVFPWSKDCIYILAKQTTLGVDNLH